MNPAIIGNATLYLGDCREMLTQLDTASVDSIVCDPPYELGFMGKSWDNTGIANSSSMWSQCLRVLKPGGHLLAFSGSRTYHRMTCAIEDAGFEIRDQIMWLYGSGFPKSLDVSKAIDKAAPRVGMFDAFAEHFSERLLASGKTRKSVAEMFPSKSGGITGCVWNWSHGVNVPMRDQWSVLQPLLGLADEWLPLIDRAEAERKVVGIKKASAGVAFSSDGPRELDITAPASDASRQWSGWGTALKPAHEPICVARKPLTGTVAANVLAHGTGAINIDGCRVSYENDAADPASNPLYRRAAGYANGNASDGGSSSFTLKDGGGQRNPNGLGRWPANVIHDGSPDVLEAFPDAPGQMADAKTNDDRKTANVYGAMRYAEPSADRVYATAGGTNFAMKPGARRLDSGSAARFFYCAKASRSDRNEGIGGSDIPAVETDATMRDRETADWQERNGNHHPTVKPTDLMAYLCRLVTPPGGIVLDHFMGSGSTGKAAIREGFKFVGMDMTPEYVDIAKARIQFEIDQIENQIAEASRQSCLFGEPA